MAASRGRRSPPRTPLAPTPSSRATPCSRARAPGARCQPCRVEMPSLERLSRRLGGADFRVVAVSVDEQGPAVVARFTQDLGLSFEILHDRSGAIQRLYQTTGVPESFVIDRDGVIIKKVIGPAEWDGPVNETLIRRLIDAR